MKTISYFKAYPENRGPAGRRMYWHHMVAKELMEMIGTDHTNIMRNPGRNSHDVSTHDVEPGHFDIAYLELFDLPKVRPADFVWASLGDFIGLQKELEAWLKVVKPNLLVTRQYYGMDLINMCAKYNCKLILKPQFIDEPQPYTSYKIHTGMISGAMGRPYLYRMVLAQCLGKFPKASGVMVAMSNGHAKYAIPEDEYRARLAQTKFVFSTGIWDVQMPPKHVEICNAGACLVSPVLPWMKDCGFIADKHYVPLPNINPLAFDKHDIAVNIARIFKYADWEIIAKAGRHMVQRLHTIDAWHTMILKEYVRWVGY